MRNCLVFGGLSFSKMSKKSPAIVPDLVRPHNSPSLMCAISDVSKYRTASCVTGWGNPWNLGIVLVQVYKFDLFSTTCVSGLVEPLSFFLEFYHKVGNFEELIEFLSKKIEFIEGSIVFCMKMLWISGKRYFCSRNILISFFSL